MPTVSHPAERAESTDPETGRRLIQWTRSPAKDQHLYFTSHSVSADGRFLVIISERSGAPNLHVIDRESGRIRQISHAEAILRAYCYPQGQRHGFSKPSPCLDIHRNRVYWVQDDAAWGCSLEEGAEPFRLAESTPGWFTGFSHVSPDGKHLLVTCADPRAFDPEDQTQGDQTDQVPWRMLEQGLSSRLFLIDTQTSESNLLAELPFWVTHVQFDPKGTGRILFNCEGKVGGHGDRRFPWWGRIWGMEPDGSWRRLYDQAEGEYLNHENWTPDGEAFVYHGRVEDRPYIAVRSWEGELLLEHPTGEVHVNHAVSTPQRHRFTADSRDGFIYLYDISASEGRQAQPLCRHDSSFNEQDSHAHPILSPDGRGVVFTSDRDGVCNVYEAPLDE